MSLAAWKLDPPWRDVVPVVEREAPASTLTVLGAALHERLTAVAASRTLAGLGERAVPVLARALRIGEPWTREMAAETLGETAARSAWNPLLRALHDPSEAVRVAAACAIERLGAPGVPHAHASEAPTPLPVHAVRRTA